MKTVLVVGMFVVGSSLQAFSMGQPHNVFTARKHVRPKQAVSIVEQRVMEPKSEASLCWQSIVKATKTMFSDLVIVAFSHISPVHSY